MHSSKPDRTLELAGAAGFLLFAAGQLFQAFVTAHLPPADDFAANLGFDLSLLNQTRLLVLFACFILFPAGYVALYRRTQTDGWALAGLVWIILFVTFELLNRGFEIGNVLAWERAWLASSDTTLRATLAARINLFGELQPTATLLILLCYALGSAALAIALRPRGRLGHLARLGLALNAIRATLRFGALVLGIDFLAPVSTAIFFPVMIFHYLTLGVWLLFERDPRR